MKRHWIQTIENWNRSGILSVLGPTGAGKTSLTLNYVRTHFKDPRLPLLVSLDSIAVYRELDIGSAKPIGAEREDFDWIGIDLISPIEKISAREFLKKVQPSIDQAISDQRPVILVGGSFFYERVLVDGPGAGETTDETFLRELEAAGAPQVYRQLILKDSRIRDRFSENDEYRVFRFADLMLRQGLGLEEILHGQTSPLQAPVNCLILGLDPKVSEDKLLNRIKTMFVLGFRQEVQALLQKYGPEAAALNSVGYRQIASNPGLTDSKLVELILVAHRQLAKKQRTWLRGLRKKSSELGADLICS